MPAPTAPAPTTTAPPVIPAPTETAPPPEAAPTLVLAGRFTRVGPPTSTVEIQVTRSRGVEVMVRVTTTSGRATLAQHSNRHHCEVGPRGTTLTCRMSGDRAALVVVQSGVVVPEPVIVTATAANGKPVTVTIPVA
jgi:hypothetical protein